MVVTIIVLVLSLSILIFIHELGHFLAAKITRTKVEEFAIGMGPRLIRVYFDGETEYTINLFPIGGYVKLQGENGADEVAAGSDTSHSFFQKSPPARIFVLVAGIVMNYLLGLVLIAIVYFSIGKPVVNPFLLISEVRPNSPAATSGIEPNNIIVGYKELLDSEYTTSFSQENFIDFVKTQQGNEIDLRIQISENDTTKKNIRITPRTDPPTGEGALGIVFAASYTITYEKLSFWQVPGESIRSSYEIVIAVYDGFTSMIRQLVTQGSVPEDIAGPIGVAKLTGDAVRQGIFPYLQLMALISINLAVVNILPIPALDGGRLIFVLFEAITKRRIPTKYEGWIHTIGFMLLMVLMVVISIVDIKRFF